MKIKTISYIKYSILEKYNTRHTTFSLSSVLSELSLLSVKFYNVYKVINSKTIYISVNQSNKLTMHTDLLEFITYLYINDAIENKEIIFCKKYTINYIFKKNSIPSADYSIYDITYNFNVKFSKNIHYCGGNIYECNEFGLLDILSSIELYG